MIEKKEAIENLEEILSVPGIDMIQWGAGDYAMSMGKAGEMGSPWVWQEERRVILLAHEKGIPVRGWLPSLEQAERYLSLGVRHFCLGTDMKIVYSWLLKEGKTLRRMMEDAER